MKKIKFYNLIKNLKIVLLIILIFIATYTYASNVIISGEIISPNDNNLQPNIETSINNLKETIRDISKLTIEERKMIEESINESYQKEINDAIAAVSSPEVASLPTLFSQPTFHPYVDDYFGMYKESSPIFSVDVANDEEKKNLMSLTFDSAYINDYTFKILDVLDKYDVKATFFMTYEFIKKNPTHVMEIIKRGHEIGNHSTTHPDLNLVRDAKVVAEVWQAHDYVKKNLGVEMCLFRFPFGSYSPRTVNLLKNLGYYPIQWTFDSIDWKDYGVDYLKKRFEGTEFLAPGSIILFHNGAKYTPDALPYILDLIKSKGLKCVRVSDLIYKHGFCLNNGHQIDVSKKEEKE